LTFCHYIHPLITSLTCSLAPWPRQIERRIEDWIESQIYKQSDSK
jgi:hypothetical protein